jgi:hypothetical protein
MLPATLSLSPVDRARFVRDRLPATGLFAGRQWRISPDPFPLGPEVTAALESLGRVLLQFYRALNLLYHQSVQGKEPPWVAAYLDRGKPPELIELQRSAPFKNELPRVIRPDVLLTENGLSISELDSVPGGIGLTAWLNSVYTELATGHGRAGEAPFVASPVLAPIPPPPAKKHGRQPQVFNPHAPIIGGADGMLRGFAGIFGEAAHVHIVLSEEAATYRPEMSWLAEHVDPARFQVRDTSFTAVAPGDAVYRFFELFDLPNVPNARFLFEAAREKRLQLTPPPKPVLEEKLMFALLWNGHLRGFWRRHLGAAYFERLLGLVPCSWVVDPAPLPPHAAIPELNLTDWRQLAGLSQRQRELILKISGFSPEAWGARGVFLGSDLSQAAWSQAVDKALAAFEHSPFVLQRYHKPRLVEAAYCDFERNQVVSMRGRARLCPYYFVLGEGDAARAYLGGVLATICPPDKKIIHGMPDAIMAPCGKG